MNRGKVSALCIAPEAGAAMQHVSEVEALVGRGLFGDRYASGDGSYGKEGDRQVTIMNCRMIEGSGFTIEETRRNIFTENIEVMSLIGKHFRIGKAILYGEKYCTPCMRPSSLASKEASFKEVFHDRGGIIAKVISPGLIRLGDSVELVGV